MPLQRAYPWSDAAALQVVKAHEFSHHFTSLDGGNAMATMNPTFCAMAHPGSYVDGQWTPGDMASCAATDTISVTYAETHQANVLSKVQ